LGKITCLQQKTKSYEREPEEGIGAGAGRDIPVLVVFIRVTVGIDDLLGEFLQTLGHLLL